MHSENVVVQERCKYRSAEYKITNNITVVINTSMKDAFSSLTTYFCIPICNIINILIRMFQRNKITIIDERDVSISVPAKKLATLHKPKIDHPMITFSNANFFRFMKTWIKDNNNPPVTTSPGTTKIGDIDSKPVKSIKYPKRSSG